MFLLLDVIFVFLKFCRPYSFRRKFLNEFAKQTARWSHWMTQSCNLRMPSVVSFFFCRWLSDNLSGFVAEIAWEWNLSPKFLSLKYFEETQLKIFYDEPRRAFFQHLDTFWLIFSKENRIWGRESSKKMPAAPWGPTSQYYRACRPRVSKTGGKR